MLQSTSRVAIATSPYEDMPFLAVLFRYLWPFWLFKDASHGDRFARAAAYRHNRSMSVYLPAYLLRWMFSSALALAIATGFESLAAHTAGALFALIAAGWGILFACNVCVLFLTGYIYLYLQRNDA